MSYLQDRTKDRRRKRLLVGVFLVLIVILLSTIGVFKGLSGVLQAIARPFWKTSDSVKVSVDGSISLVRSKSSLAKENYTLNAKVAELEGSMLDYQLLKKENEELKNILDRAPEKNDFILATILTKPNRSPYDTIVVDIGEDKGLYVGQHVFANTLVPIGKILEVYARTSLVRLYSSPGEITEAQVDGSNASVEIVGRGGGNFEMVVPHDMEISSGADVILPNINSRIVAIVADIVSDPRDPLKKVILRSPVNIQDLKWVQILK